jgi:23S rRNA-/tRNA-specific pseudouridylate synthase
MFVKKQLVRMLHPEKPSSTELIDFDYAKDFLDKITIFDNKNITILNKPPQFSVQGGEDVMKNIFSLMAARYKK